MYFIQIYIYISQKIEHKRGKMHTGNKKKEIYGNR